MSIPLADLLARDANEDFSHVFEVFFGAAANDYSMYIDDLGFVNP